jgi:NADH-quinone oxidoreductase subunit I
MLFTILQRMGRVSKAFGGERVKIDVSKEVAHYSPTFRGQHEIKTEICTGCDACNKICPVDAINMIPLPLKKPNKVPEVNLGICIFCGLCEDVCPTKPEKAIKLAGGTFEMITGGLAEDQHNYWLKPEIDEEWVAKVKAEEEEKARKRAEAKAKKDAEAKAKKEAEAAAAAANPEANEAKEG